MIAAQARKLFVFVTSLWLASFVSSRVMLFQRELVQAQQNYADDQFTLATVCGNNDIRANLGRNGHICETAAVAVRIPPWQTALAAVFAQTYLCGDTPCLQILHGATSTVTSMVFTVVCALISPWAFAWLFEKFLRKIDHRRAKRRVREDLLPLDDGPYKFD